MLPPRLHGRGSIALFTALAVLAPSPALASAGPTDPPPLSSIASAAPPAPATTLTVTLITGEKVTATRTADGSLSPQVRDADGRLTGFTSSRAGGDTYVYPHGVLPYVSAGLLDKQLFNITELVADGYDDAHRDQLPLIVTYTDAAARSRTASAPEGARDVRSLDSIQGAALNVDRSETFWSSITGGEEKAARSTGERLALSGGIAKIWLDGKVEATLADSTAQVGAPQVWASGNTGQGIDVAVLDTGIDVNHPDFAGQIAATESFVPGETVKDVFGHGTHVASTIAGTGAASDGKEKGVAPGVRLHVGKVIGDDNAGQDSWIISGMEWAVRDQHAKIVNMSLGADPTDGTDPMSVAVNELSEETGALFVIAAGNAGPNPYTVGSPGTADAALTVGAVNGNDVLADFSSQGPRVGDRALKPDLTAPGVGVLAARSQDSPGEGWYRLSDGTSMATPHVAGAAALLAAQHPDFTGKQLKEALVSTTKAIAGLNPYQGGNGRLDIAATTAASVVATTSADFGYPEWPTAPKGRVEREVRYTNLGDSPVTLDLTATVDGGPVDLFTLSSRQITVPARGVTSVTVATDFDRVPADNPFAGFLTATDASGAVRTRTSLAVGREGVRHRLTFTAKDRSGKPTGGDLVLLGQDNTVLQQQIDGTGTLDLRLPPGTYAAWLRTDLEGANGPSSRGLGVLPVPEITLDQDRTVVFDATKARRATTTTPQDSTVDGARFELFRDFGGNPWTDAWYPDPAYDSVWVLPTDRKVTKGKFAFGTQWRMAQPALTVTASGHDYDDLRVQRAGTPLPRGDQHFDAVFAGDGGSSGYTKLNARGEAVVVRRNDAVPLEKQAAAAASAGARLLLVVNDGDGRLAPWPGSVWAPQDPPPVTVATLTRDEGEQLIARIRHERRVRLDVTSHPTTEYVYDLVHNYTGAVPADLAERVTPRDLARVDMSFRNWRSGRALEMRSGVTPSGTLSGIDYHEVPARGERTDWVTAGTQWSTNVQVPDEQSQQSAPTVYRAGSVQEERWFGPVQRPRLLTASTVFRGDGDAISALIPGWGDSGTAHEGSTSGNFAVDNVLRLYQGNTLVGETDRYQMMLGSDTLSPEPLPYRLVSENRRDAWAGPYSTATRTEWGFTSGRVSPGVLWWNPALIQLDYAIDTDVDGKAKRNADLTVTALHLPMATEASAIRTVTLDVSYDDGATWHHAKLQRKGDGWRTRIDAPRTAGFVTLRATARDGSGNSIDQSITRAFGLR
ncbi:subtilisin family serine protease [Micromonospora pisi]|uniref:Subtilisin family serine protease n=1 Tax=Micromonospora pisi TaxID=589240 RepID=A0A495JVN0_9ACTN|nr:S8 family serine peptidase [Micromonospora pisi]RKR92209.1 subtilisin family serine protease [Micromonospora pisi]